MAVNALHSYKWLMKGCFSVRFLQIFLFIAGFLAVSGAWAQEEGPYVKLRVLPEHGTIAAGETMWIGLEQSITPGWHTYWKNTGDSGATPRMQWTLPEGFEISEITWPVPHKLPYGPLLNYGYSDHVILLQKLSAPATLPGGPVDFSLKAEILVCKEECIPETSVHEFTLNGPESGAENNAAYLQDATHELPVEAGWSPEFSEDGGNFILKIPASETALFNTADLGSFEFFPEDWGLIDNAAMPVIGSAHGAIIIKQTRGERPLNGIEQTRGILTYKNPDGIRRALAFTATKPGATAATPTATEGGPAMVAFIQALALALLGGLILNLMPCVFPVLSIKALSLVKISEKHPELARKLGLSYTAGVVLCFLAIAASLIALKIGGAGLGWGFQLQNPVVVGLLAYLLFAIGLNLSGFFEIGGSLGSWGNKLTQGEGLPASFFTGVLATLVATPCTAPFMAAAIGYALVQPPVIALSIFAALGFGLALPYLLLSFIPKLRAFLPKPGAWMEIFRQFLAFPMFASAAWLVWVLAQQAGHMGLLGVLLGMIAIAFALWLLGHQPKTRRWRVVTIILAVLSLLLAIGFLPSGDIDPAEQAVQHSGMGEEYTPAKLAALLDGDKPVFVEMTAAWCLTCKVNHAAAIDVESTRALFKEMDVQYLVGDWTNEDPAITEYLNSYGRNGVPIYVYYGPPGETGGERPEARVLPQVLTPGIVKDYLTGNN